MAKLIVEIPMSFNESVHGMKFSEYVKKYADDFFPTEDKSMISIDVADLEVDPSEDEANFFLFKLVRIED